MQQTTNHIMMIRPVMFRFNEQTAVNNYYQHDSGTETAESVQEHAQNEFDVFVKRLRGKGVNVTVINDTLDPSTPDSIFPNNWVSFHQDGTVGLYPMFAENRRLERREDIFDQLKSQDGFEIKQFVDFTEFEKESKFLEGTGSMILDRPNKIVYAAISERMNETVLLDFCSKFGYRPVVFTAYQSVDGKRLPIYHTNVMMCIAETFAVVCLDSIDNEEEKESLISSIDQTGKELITITEDQCQQFAGNMLQVIGAEEERFLVMSSAAYHSLSPDQITRINKHCEIIHSNLSTIETLGGGSARCMMAEVFLPKS